MGAHWIETVKRLTVGQGREAAHDSGERIRKARMERLINSVTAGGTWDLSLSDGELAVHARNLAVAFGADLRLSDAEIMKIGDAVVWNIRFRAQPTEA